MRLHIHFLGAALGVLLTGADLPAQSGGYRVIVNEANPVTALSATEVSRLFLKKVTRWGNGQTVVPVDQVQSSHVRDAFSERILGRPTTAIRAYWNQELFSGRGVPPLEKKSDAEVIEYVRNNPGAIGYVSDDQPLGNGVRNLEVGR